MFTRIVDLAPRQSRLKVALCIPAPEMLWKKSRNCLRDLRDAALRNFDLIDVDVDGSDVVACRNLLVVGGKPEKPDYYLFLDSDQTYPADTLERLLAHGKDVIGATYVRRAAPYSTLGQVLDGSDIESIWNCEKLVEMAAIPFGCLLVKASVFPLLDKPLFRHGYRIVAADVNEPGHQTAEDYNWCERVREAGMAIWCDVSLSKEVGHLGGFEFRWNSKVRA